MRAVPYSVAPRTDWEKFSGCPDLKANKEQSRDKTPNHDIFLRQGLSHSTQVDLELGMHPRSEFIFC